MRISAGQTSILKMNIHILSATSKLILSFMLFFVIFEPCSSAKNNNGYIKEPSDKVVSTIQSLNCCKTLEDEITDIQIEFALLKK